MTTAHKQKILLILEKNPMNMYSLVQESHLNSKKVSDLLELMSIEGEIEFSQGKFKLVDVDLLKLNPLTVNTPENIRKRDYSKYTINGGEEVGKARLVLEVIKKFVHDNPGVSMKKIKEVFPDTLHPKFGVVQPLVEAIKKSEKHKRFFVDSPVKAGRTQIAVCREWSKDNIIPFLSVAKGLGFNVEPVVSS